MRLRRNRPARWANTTRSCSSCTLNRPLGNFSKTVPVTSMLSSLLILLFYAKSGPPRWLGSGPRNPSGGGDVGRLQTLGALGHLELHLGAFIQRAVALRLDSREVHKYVLPVFSLNKSVALGCVEPLHRTFFFHLPRSF